jgi:hypothetical protein
MAQTPIHVNGQLRGLVINRELTQRRRASIHMLRSPPSWAEDDEVLRQARELGALRVRIIDTESGAEYVADMDDFDAHGVPVDRGYGKQTALQLHFWRKQDGDTASPVRAVVAVQAGLFA